MVEGDAQHREGAEYFNVGVAWYLGCAFIVRTASPFAIGNAPVPRVWLLNRCS